MSDCAFVVGNKYTKSDIYAICGVPANKQNGNWNTGYTNYDGDWFIFCNVGTPGRTGHDYANSFVGDELRWFGKTTSHIEQDSIKSLLNPDGNVFVFYREVDRDPFTFAGIAKAASWEDTTPVEITWSFGDSSEQRPEVLAEEVTEPQLYIEGATKTISVNVYERNPHARAACIAAHGCDCCICGFSFGDAYGEIGDGFIHVHHLKQLADIGAEYELDPINDLRPVCPNCHAMLHRRRPAYSIDELRALRAAAND